MKSLSLSLIATLIAFSANASEQVASCGGRDNSKMFATNWDNKLPDAPAASSIQAPTKAAASADSVPSRVAPKKR